MAKIPHVAVIVLSYNSERDTLESVRSLAASNVKGFEMKIVVVDNASKDDTVKKLKKLGLYNLKIISNRINLGFAEGNNVGMRYALKEGFDYIALLNNDTFVDKDLIGNILSEHEKFIKAGAISPKIYFAKGFEYHKKYKSSDLGRVIWYAGGVIDWQNFYGSNRGVDQVDNGQYEEVIDTDFATGCFVMFKAKVLKEVGLYNHRYFVYMEDVEHSLRLKENGWKVLYSSKGHMWHKVARASGIGSSLNDYYLTRNRILLGIKYAPLRTKLALLKESVKLLIIGRKWQKIGIRDYYLGRFGKGSWND